MRLTVLADNNTYIDQYYLGEPAACYYIEDAGHALLFDTGYSDVFIKNADALSIDLRAVSSIVFSHGHDDHTRGLTYLMERQSLAETTLFAHPDTFIPRVCDGRSIGSPLSETQVRERAVLRLSREPVHITPNVIFLGEIPTTQDFEPRRSIGTLEDGASTREDVLLDDTALVHSGPQGLFIITGCSHSGICNIIEHAKRVCGKSRVRGVIGGFHLLQVSEQLQKTIEYFATNNIEDIYPCHCVSLAAKAEMYKHLPIHEVGVGLSLDFNILLGEHRMRRKTRECQEPAFLEEVLTKAEDLYLAFRTDDYPYIIPLNFVYFDKAIYIHCALEGRKLNLLRQDPRVGFSTSVDVEISREKYTTYYKSVCGTGVISIVEDQEEKGRALDALGARYAALCPRPSSASALRGLHMLRIDINSLSGKRNRPSVPETEGVPPSVV